MSYANLPQLPYALNALAPHISGETLEYHYGKHHKAYVDNLNNLVRGTEHEKKSLEDIIKTSQGGVFNNAAQVWNHTFYWHCLTPQPTEPKGVLLEEIKKTFGSVEDFTKNFSDAAIRTFGSGWAWLVVDDSGKLAIESTSNADTPMRTGKKTLLTCDVWEHAYYIDYRNARPKYVDAFWKLVNWDFASKNLSE
ncbi:MAG: superoxide dismutase [Fe] [Bdellovibrionales bacterium CG10_big_fil_rev_8_21_14_0_10_45_34]|nr:MAG: superoxide dismutase [Fe] [Bdellovibrionales bacterium CG10_big_fil_rev_8_21_14_0_10_45_34]